MSRIAHVSVAVLLCFLAAFAISSPSSDAASDIHFSGDHVFTDDESYPDGSTIIIDSGAKVNVGSFTWTIGKNSSIKFEGAAEITCTTGKISVGADTSLTMFGTLIKGFTYDAEYTFDGTAVFSGVSSQTSPAISFSDAGTVLTISWEQSKMEITDFLMYQELNGDDLSRIVGFSAFRYTSSVYESEKLVSSKIIEVAAGETDKTIMGTIHVSANTADVTFGTLNEVKVTSRYTESDLVSTTTVKQITGLQASIAATGMAHITASAEQIDIVKSVAGKESNSISLADVDVDTNLNIRTLFKIVVEGVEGSSPDWLEDLGLTAASCTIKDISLGTTTNLTSLSLTIDKDATDYLTVVANEGDSKFTVTASEVVFTKFGINRYMEISLEATVQDLTVKKEVSGALASKTTLTNLGLKVEDLDLKTMFMLYSRTGTKAIQHLLDSSDKVDLKADSLTMDTNGDGVDDATIATLSAVFLTNTLKLYTMTVEFGSLDASIPINDKTATVKFGKTGLYMESSGSMSQCLDFLLSGSDFTSDAHAEIRLNLSGFTLSYPIEGGTVSLEGTPSSATTPPDATMMISMNHSEILKATTLSGKITYIGHTVTAEVHKAYTEPAGNLDLVLKTRDGSASFEFEFGSGIGFSVNLNVPWTFELQYYGISIQADAGVSNISLTHGRLGGDGFDITSTGALGIPALLSQKDFTLDTRLTMEVNSLKVYTDNRSSLRADISDMEFEVRKISADVRHGVSIDAALQKIIASYVAADGSLVEKSLGHLNLSKDLSGAEKGKGLLETVMVWVLVISAVGFVVLAAMLIRLRIKEPELFAFNEHTDEGTTAETVPEGDNPEGSEETAVETEKGPAEDAGEMREQTEENHSEPQDGESE